MANEQFKATSNSLTEKIYNEILAKLMANELPPGTIIDRKSLAEEYNVSLAPVREALQRLTLEGIVETKSRSATVVKGVTKEDVQGIMALREALEVQVCRMICGDIVKANLDSLLNAARAVDENGDNITEYWKADIAFHRSLVELSDCKLITETYIKAINIPAFYNINSFFMNYDPEKRESHVALVTLLSECGPDEAEIAIRRHLNSGKSRDRA